MPNVRAHGATYAALLRAINVGGTGKLAMGDLKQLCEQCGFTDVVTYIQSGNVVFNSKLSATRAQHALAEALEHKLHKKVGVFVRTREELRAIHCENPFAGAVPSQVLVVFLEAVPSTESVSAIRPPGREKLVLHGRELFIHYPDGMGKSKLKVPFAQQGTGRNLNTVQKLVELSGA